MDIETSIIQNLAARTNATLENEIVLAIESLLEQYNDKKKGLRILSKKMGIHEKTLTRILNFENKPGYQTVFKIYRVFYNEFNDAKVLDLVPGIVKEFLIKSNSQELSLEKKYSTIADIELQKNPIVAELYIIAATGPIQFDQILNRFGSYGVEILTKMIDKGLLHEAHKNTFILGEVHPVFNGETIVSVGSVMIANHAKPYKGDELDKNFISFFAEGLTESAFQQWLLIDQEAHKKKIELSRDPKNLGSERAFTFMISEKIELNGVQ